jgi:hypothetical protein
MGVQPEPFVVKLHRRSGVSEVGGFRFFVEAVLFAQGIISSPHCYAASVIDTGNMKQWDFEP